MFTQPGHTDKTTTHKTAIGTNIIPDITHVHQVCVHTHVCMQETDHGKHSWGCAFLSIQQLKQTHHKSFTDNVLISNKLTLRFLCSHK